jgi:type III pantothenate kinase
VKRIATVDQGNGSAKFTLWELERGGVRMARRRRSSREQWSAPAGLGFVQEWSPDALAISSVAGEAGRTELAERIATQLRCPLLLDLDSGLENRTRTPETVGQDRLFAARGAVELVGRSAIVVDAGTALTVDALQAAVEDRPAAFLGGAIAPGPDLLAASLASGAAQLYSIEPRAGVPALGRDTREALEAGVSVGFLGAARELVLRIAEAAGFDAPDLVVTGGARGLLRTLEAPGAGRRFEVEELVERGLLAAAGEALTGTAWKPPA